MAAGSVVAATAILEAGAAGAIGLRCSFPARCFDDAEKEGGAAILIQMEMSMIATRDSSDSSFSLSRPWTVERLSHEVDLFGGCRRRREVALGIKNGVADNRYGELQQFTLQNQYAIERAAAFDAILLLLLLLLGRESGWQVAGGGRLLM